MRDLTLADMFDSVFDQETYALEAFESKMDQIEEGIPVDEGGMFEDDYDEEAY